MNALLRTAHLKEILSWHTNMHFKGTNTLPYWCQNIIFFILEPGKISDTLTLMWSLGHTFDITFIAGNQKMRTHYVK